MLIPKEWLPQKLRQNRIINHWSVTSYTPGPECLSSYHLVIDGKGNIHRGDYDLDQPMAHTYGFNSAVGISLACMGGFVSFNNPGPYPPTKEQWETLVAVNRQLVQAYDIPVTPRHVLMHGEVTEQLGLDQWGKWDIGWLPHLGLSSCSACGNELRSRILDLEVVEIPVIVQYGDTGKQIEGLLFEGATIVPARKFCIITGKELEVFNNKQCKVNGVIIPMMILKGTGYIELRKLAVSTVIEWTKVRRVVRIEAEQ